METEQILELNPLCILQSRINCPKKQYNSFGEYYYRSLEDIFEALKPHLKDLGLSLQLTDEVILVGDRYYVCATATLYDFNMVALATSKGWAREELEKKKADASQLTGVASSYARKYALSALLCLDDVKDADADTKEGKEYRYDLRKLGDKETVDKAVEFFAKQGIEAEMGENNEIIIVVDKPIKRLKNCEILGGNNE